MLELAVQQVVNGLLVGAIYALMALGLMVILGILRIINMAQGELYMLGGYFCYVAVVATGDSFAAQLGPVVHFGLGTASSVDKLEIRWPEGKVDTLATPAVDRYHDVGTR